MHEPTTQANYFHATRWSGDLEGIRRYFAAVSPEPTWGLRGNTVWVMTADGTVEVPFGHWILTDGMSGRFVAAAFIEPRPPSVTDDL